MSTPILLHDEQERLIQLQRSLERYTQERPTNSIEDFEAAFAEMLGIPDSILTDGFNRAANLALGSLDLPKKSSVLLAGCDDARWNPILKSHGLQSANLSLEALWALDLEALEDALSSRTKLLILSHRYGIPWDMDAILDICEAYDIFLIEDIGCACGARYKGQLLGSFGDAGIFHCSHSSPLTVMGSPAAAVFVDPSLAPGLKSQRGDLEPVQAYLLADQLSRMEEINLIKEKRVIDYQFELSGLPGIELLPDPLDGEPVFDAFWLKTPSAESLSKSLKTQGVESLLSGGNILGLPCHAALTTEQIKHVCSCVHAFFEKQKSIRSELCLS